MNLLLAPNLMTTCILVYAKKDHTLKTELQKNAGCKYILHFTPYNKSTTKDWVHIISKNKSSFSKKKIFNHEIKDD